MADTVNTVEISLAQLDGYNFQVNFGREHYTPLHVDEPPPLSQDTAPNATRLLAAAIGNCLAASLVFCLSRQHKVALAQMKTRVLVDIVRNEQRRYRVGKVTVHMDPGPVAAAHPEALAACKGAFEDFCTVTQSIRAGIPVEVHVADGTSA